MMMAIKDLFTLPQIKSKHEENTQSRERLTLQQKCYKILISCVATCGISNPDPDQNQDLASRPYGLLNPDPQTS
jgi:hypothetical protein